MYASFSDYLYESICLWVLIWITSIWRCNSNGYQQTYAFIKKVDKTYTGCYLTTTELLDCALIGVHVVIRSNTVIIIIIIIIKIRTTTTNNNDSEAAQNSARISYKILHLVSETRGGFRVGSGRGGGGWGWGSVEVGLNRIPLWRKISFSWEILDKLDKFGDTIVTLNIYTPYSLSYTFHQQGHFTTCELV